MTELTHAELKRLVSYDPETGIFRNAKGRQLGSDTANATIVSIKGRAYTAMRLAWFYVHGVWPSGQTRAKNGNGLDARIANITVPAQRVAAEKKTSASRTPYICGRDGVYRVRGVVQEPATGQWVARPTIRGKRQFLGRFETRDAAEKAVVDAF